MYDRVELARKEVYLLSLKTDLQDEEKRKRMNIGGIKSYISDLDEELRSQLDTYYMKRQAATVTTATLSLATLVAWFFSLPVWLQYVLFGLAVVALIVTGYFILTSKDPEGNLLRLIRLIGEIWAIIQNIPVPTPTPEPTPTPIPSEVPPGVHFVMVGTAPVAQIGGMGQQEITAWQQGGEGWPGGTVSVDGGKDDPHYSLWAFWYNGALAQPGWMISQQGYYNLKYDLPQNCIHSIVPTPWIQPGMPAGVSLAEVKSIERVNGRYELTMVHDGQEQRIVWMERA